MSLTTTLRRVFRDYDLDPANRVNAAWLNAIEGKVGHVFDAIADFGCIDDGETDNYSLLSDALAQIPVCSLVLLPNVSQNTYRLSHSLNIKRTVTLTGMGFHQFTDLGYATQLMFDAGIEGVVIDTATTLDATTISSGLQVGGMHSRIGNLNIVSAGGKAAGGGHTGVWIRGVAYLGNFCIRGWSGKGLKITATAGGGGADEGNANCWGVRNGWIVSCGGDGIYVEGNDVNTGSARDIFLTDIDGVGLNEKSLIGNTYDNISGANVAGEFITALGPSGTGSEFNHPYYDGVKFNTINYPHRVQGGGITLQPGSTGFQSGSGGIAQNGAFRYEAMQAATKLAVQLGVNDASQSISLRASSDESAGLTLGNREVYNSTFKVWTTQTHAGVPIVHTPNSLTAAAIPLPFVSQIFENGLFGGPIAAPHALTWGTAAPTTGTWRKGDIRLNTNIGSGSPIGWGCSTPGTPGTWIAGPNWP